MKKGTYAVYKNCSPYVWGLTKEKAEEWLRNCKHYYPGHTWYIEHPVH